ncbi:MAG: heme ABC transporter permease [Alphaproteobacteria bacterium]|nr:heme ABC transporter permease [Alphaproteobacteria bacterium]
MWHYANPKTFLDTASRFEPWLWGLASFLIAGGLYAAFFLAPIDYQQKDSVRIMYVHVPSAWMSMFIYGVMAVASIVGFAFKHPLADVAAKAAAPIGAAFTFVCLVTGSLWGRPMWGTYWEWDARITSVFVLFLLYLGYIALWRAIEDPTRAAKAAAILCLVGVINIPIIRFSVDWWNTLHQPASVFRLDGPTIHPSMLWPLLVMGLGFTVLSFALLLLRMRTEVLERRLRALRLRAGGG